MVLRAQSGQPMWSSKRTCQLPHRTGEPDATIARITRRLCAWPSEVATAGVTPWSKEVVAEKVEYP